MRSSTRPLRRALLGLTTGLTAAALVAGGAVTPAQAATAEARVSSDWLATQLDDGLVVSEYYDGSAYQQYTDFGLTLDVYYAFGQAGVKAPRRTAILAAIEPRAAEYTDAFGTTYAGAMGKLLTAVESAGIDPASYGTGDLVSRLESLVVTTGAETGRAKDDTTFSDSSNTFGQAYVATGLAAAGSALADEATAFLLQQQCAAGFFRQGMDSADFTCDGGTPEQSAPSIDATATAAIAAHALSVAGPASERADARKAFKKAVAWLASRQVASGTFAGGRNSNSTGLAATALGIAGKDVRAAKAAAWVDGLRVTRALVRATKYRPRDLGAVAFDRGALSAGKRDGITRDNRYEWRRATAQAAPALDLLGS